MTNPMDAINAAGGNFASFPEIGSEARGTVVSFIYDDQYTDYNGEPNPCPVVTVDSGGEHLKVPLDNGRKRFAVKKALEDANEDAIEVGGSFVLRYTEDGEAKRGQHPPKMFQAGYKAPDRTAAANDMLADEAPFTGSDATLAAANPAANTESLI